MYITKFFNFNQDFLRLHSVILITKLMDKYHGTRVLVIVFGFSISYT